MRKYVLIIVIISIFLCAVYGAWLVERGEPVIRDGVLENYLNTGATNAVAAVYLDFRILDTLLEAFLLLLCVMGIGQFLRLEDIEKIHFDDEGEAFDHSPIVGFGIKLTLPFLIIYGLYVIAFGAHSPGGGFQGGAILAAVSMFGYLSGKPMGVVSGMKTLAHLEELLFVSFLIFVGAYFLFYNSVSANWMRSGYMLICGFLIGFKVAVGLSAVFWRFTGSAEHRTSGGNYE